jgi:hypothetical protein
LLFSAFTHEAFLNTLGPKIISFWTELEYLRPNQKLTIIAETLHYRPDFGQRPYQTLKALFEFRNAMAHGRDEQIPLEGETTPRLESGVGYTEAVTAEWVAYCTVKNAKQAYEDVEKIARDLSDRAKVENMPNYPFGSPESSMLRIMQAGAAIGSGRLITRGKLTMRGDTVEVADGSQDRQKS